VGSGGADEKVREGVGFFASCGKDEKKEYCNGGGKSHDRRTGD